MVVVSPIPAFNDNYIWAFGRQNTDTVCIVDPGDAEPVLEFLQSHQLTPEAIIITHHHADHIGGVENILSYFPVPVYGPATPKIPQITNTVSEGDYIDVAGVRFQVIEVPGHTMEHIAYFADNTGAAPLLFCGDTLFAAGCGRMFEGTAPVMHASLQKLAGLPPTTEVYCAHEYTLANLQFAKAAMPESAAVVARIKTDSTLREQGTPTVPSTIGVELATNPFLRCDDQQIRKVLKAKSGNDAGNDANVFGQLRQWKDNF